MIARRALVDVDPDLLPRRLLLVSLWPRQPAAIRYRGRPGDGAWGYIVGPYDKDAGANNQRLYLNGTRVAQMSDTLPSI
jgi:hypothetical protein